LFFEFTKESGTHEYQKVRHGLLLSRYLIKHPAEDLSNLATMLSELIDFEPS
jgi:hypothetical protein